MKKLVSMFLAVLMMAILTLSSAAFAEDDEWIDVTPTLTSIIDSTASEWYSSKDNRALLAALIILDTLSSVEDDRISEIVASALVEDSIYIAKFDYSLILYFFGEDSSLACLYSPILEQLGVNVDNDLDSSDGKLFMSYAVANDTFSSYEHISGEDFLQMMSDVIELFE